MPVKNGDMVYYKIKNGQIRSGKYDSKTKSVTNKSGRKAFPPKKAMHHTIQGAKNAPFVARSSSTDILGAPMKYSGKGKVPKGSHRMPDGSIMKDSDMKKPKNEKEKPTPKKKENIKKTSMYELEGEGIYKPGTYQLKSVFTQEGFRSLPKSEFKRLDHEVEAGTGTAIANFTDKKAKEYRKFLKENNAFSEGLTFQKVRQDNLQFYQYTFKRLADSRKKK